MRGLFLFLSAVVVGAFASWALGLGTPERVEPPSAEPLKIIDVHTHTGFDGRIQSACAHRHGRDESVATVIPDTLQEYLKEFQEAGVVGAVSMGAAGSLSYKDLSAHNVIQCLGVGSQIQTLAIDEALASRKFRCIKIYLGYTYRYAYDEAYRPVYELARKHGVPVVFHTGDTYSIRGKLKYSDPLTIDEVAVDFPDVKFVIAHMGNPWIQSAAEVAYKNPNVFAEASALIIGDLKLKPVGSIEELGVKPIRWAFQYIENPSKLMFGSDWPLVRIPEYVELYKRAIPREHWSKVFYENAVEVFGFQK